MHGMCVLDGLSCWKRVAECLMEILQRASMSHLSMVRCILPVSLSTRFRSPFFHKDSLVFVIVIRMIIIVKTERWLRHVHASSPRSIQRTGETCRGLLAPGWRTTGEMDIYERLLTFTLSLNLGFCLPACLPQSHRLFFVPLHISLADAAARLPK